MVKLILLSVALLLLPITAYAGETSDWMTSDPDTNTKIHEWFNTSVVAMCCSTSDAYEADDFDIHGDQYVAVITDGSANQWRVEIPNGTKFVIPNDRIKFTNPPNPTGHGVLFIRVYPGTDDPPHIYCFFPPSSG